MPLLDVQKALARMSPAALGERAGLQTLSILPEALRRQLLDAWVAAGGGTAAFFAAEADALLAFIAARLPDSSLELAVCELERLTIRANGQSPNFEAPVSPEVSLHRIVQRGRHAGVVHWPPAGGAVPATVLLIAPGLPNLSRAASAYEQVLWDRLAVPATVTDLVSDGFSCVAIAALLNVGAADYATD